MATEDHARWMTAAVMLIRTHTRFWDQLESHMQREHGLTMARYDVLAQLNLAGGRLGLSALAAAIFLSPSGLSKLLDRMDAAGLIRREPDPNDARAAVATITPRGEAVIKSARTTHHELLHRIFGEALTDRDLADLTRILSRLDASVAGRRP